MTNVAAANAATANASLAQLPLTPTVFYMLLALADGDKHGYAIMQSIEQESQGRLVIRIGSLYGSIRRMVEAGLIEETQERPDPQQDDERRRYYGLTPQGRALLHGEAARLAQAVNLLRAKSVLEGV